MNARWLPVLKTYCHGSWGEFLFLALFAIWTVVLLGTGWPFSASDEDGARAIAGALRNPFWLTVFPLTAASTVRSRLRALDHYSFSFLAPGYRRAHVEAALLILASNWLLVVAIAGAAYLVETAGVLAAITGVTLARGTHPWSLPLRMLAGIWIVLLGGAWLLWLQVPPRWAAPSWLSWSLLVLGSVLTIHALRAILAREEYADADALRRSRTPVNAHYYWLDTSLADEFVGSPREQEPPIDLRGRYLQALLGRLPSPVRDAAGCARLEAAATGEAVAGLGWLLFVTALAISTVAIMARADPQVAVIAPFVMAPAGMLAVAPVLFSPRWSVGRLWLRSPMETRVEVLRAMRAVKFRSGLRTMIAVLVPIAAGAGFAATSDDGWPEGYEVFCLSLALAITGSIALFVACGLRFERFGRALTTLFAFAVLASLWLLCIVAQARFVPEVLRFASLPASGFIFITGILSLAFVQRWWFDGWFARRDHVT